MLLFRLSYLHARTEQLGIRRRWRAVLSIAALGLGIAQWASAQSGVVKSGRQPLPGAVITASHDAEQVKTITNLDGTFKLPLPHGGPWTVDVQMFGFAGQKRDLDALVINKPFEFDLQLAPSPFVTRLQQAASRGVNSQTSNQLETQAQSDMAAANAPPPSTASGGTNEAFLISGSLSGGLAPGSVADTGPGPSPGGGGGLEAGQGGGGAPNAPGFGGSGGSGGGGFGGGGFGGGGRGGFGGGGGARRGGGNQRGGNARRGVIGNRRAPSAIHGLAFFSLNNSEVNARPYSFTGQDLRQPAYAQSRFGLVLGGPLGIPKLFSDPKTFFTFSYFGTRSRAPQSFIQTLPSALERSGNFSQSVQALASRSSAPVQVYDPATGAPFAGNVIPSSRINQSALGLLNYYPLPNQPGNVNNYLFQTAVPQDTDNLSTRVQRNITSKDRLSGSFNLQNRSGETAQALQFFDPTSGLGLRASLQWTRNITASLTNTATVNFNRNRNQTTPFFANGTDVARLLNIAGTSANPVNYGPPNLNFTNFAQLNDSAPVLSRNQSQGFQEALIWNRGKHTFTFGGQYTRSGINTITDQNGRGTYNFTGLRTSAIDARGLPVSGTGFDLADFLLGFPQSSSIRFGDSSLYFRQNSWSAYVQDDWKVTPSLTFNVGGRYEYCSPFHEKYGRLANLDIGPGFQSVAVVTPGSVGPFSGQFDSSLINTDRNNFSPRLALAWKVPHMKRSTIVRTGYGIYYNGQAYNPFNLRLAQQPPFAVSYSANTSPARILTLNTGFTAVQANDITNTFAVDRNYRTPYAQSWNFTIQHDLPHGFFTELGYVGTKGTRLDVQTLPNQGPSGTVLDRQNQVGNATGFTFDSSVGNSIYHAFTARLTRRFNRNASFSAYYTWSKSIDNSSTFGGSGNTVAQNWLDLSAERGLSSFDRRHSFDVNGVLSSPVGSAQSRIAADTLAGRLLKDWQLSGSLTAQTGSPLTARVLGNQAQLAQTGAIGRGRADATGVDLSGGDYFNLAAFGVPPPGRFGNAGRNTIPGPGQVTLNLAVARSIELGDTRRRLEFRVEGNNVLNHTNFTNINTVVNASNYGLPISAQQMRVLNLAVRLRF